MIIIQWLYLLGDDELGVDAGFAGRRALTNVAHQALERLRSVAERAHAAVPEVVFGLFGLPFGPSNGALFRIHHNTTTRSRQRPFRGPIWCTAGNGRRSAAAMFTTVLTSAAAPTRMRLMTTPLPYRTTANKAETTTIRCCRVYVSTKFSKNLVFNLKCSQCLRLLIINILVCAREQARSGSRTGR